jgi:hypothetical protein
METDRNSSGKQGATTYTLSPEEQKVLEVLKNSKKPLFLRQITQLVNIDEFRVFEILVRLGKRRLVSVDLSAIIYPQPISTALWVYGTKCRPIEKLNEINKSAHEGRGFLEEGDSA